MFKSRDVEFRAYSKVHDKMLNVNTIFFKEKYVLISLEDNTEEQWDFKDIVLMQYIGIKDNAGVKIFEGDYMKNNMLDNVQQKSYVFYESGIPFYGYPNGKKRPINSSKINYLGWVSIRSQDGFFVDGNIFVKGLE